MITGIHHTSITTPDLDRLVRFYVEALGFEEISRSSWEKGNPTADAIYGLEDTAVKMAMLKTSNSYLELFQFIAPIGANPDPQRPICNAGVTHICVVVEDIWAEIRTAGCGGHEVSLPAAGCGQHRVCHLWARPGWQHRGADAAGPAGGLSGALCNVGTLARHR